MAVSQLHLHSAIYMDTPVYNPGIDIGEISAMSSIKVHETEEKYRTTD